MATLKEDALILGGTAIALIVGAWYVKKKAGEAGTALAGAAGKALDAVTPWNPENVFNQAANGIYQWATGSTGSIGADYYDFLHTKQKPNETVNPTIFTGGSTLSILGNTDQRPYTVDKWGNKIREPIEGQIWE